MESSIEEVFRELNKNSAPVISKEDYKKAEREINEKMEEVRRESSMALGRAIESARHTWVG